MVKLGSPGQFEQLRELLDANDYSEAALCDRLGLESLLKFELNADTLQATGWDTDGQGLLIRLFVEGRYVPLPVAAGFFGQHAVQNLADLGLIERNPANSEEISATVNLYSTAGVYLISDRWNNPDRTSYKPPADVVYPAIVSNAQYFLRFLPRTPCQRMLDLGTGTGVAALVGARSFARHAVGADIAQRCREFAEFNARLNGIENFRAVQGDLYEPVAGQRFDRIVSHPPYVPVFKHRYLYRDGGADGEQIVQRVIAGLPAHLESGGLLYLMALVSDRDSESFEQRVRRWLGEASEDFDVANFPINSVEPEEYAVRASIHTEKPAEDLKLFKELFSKLAIKSMIYVILLVQRKTEPRDVFTVRRQGRTDTAVGSMLWLMDFERSLRLPGGIERLLDARLTANRDTSFRVTHTLGDEGWEVGEYVLQTGRPFSMEARTDPWAAHLLAAAADGKHTLRELMELLKENEALPAALPPEDFAHAAGALISGGFLQMER